MKQYKELRRALCRSGINIDAAAEAGNDNGGKAGCILLSPFFLCGKAETNIENVCAGCVYFVNDGL